MLCYVMLCYVMLSSMRCMPPGERGLWGGEAQVGGRARDIIRVGWGGEGDEPGQVRPSQAKSSEKKVQAGQGRAGHLGHPTEDDARRRIDHQVVHPSRITTTRWSILPGYRVQGPGRITTARRATANERRRRLHWPRGPRA